MKALSSLLNSLCECSRAQAGVDTGSVGPGWWIGARGCGAGTQLLCATGGRAGAARGAAAGAAGAPVATLRGAAARQERPPTPRYPVLEKFYLYL